MLNEDQILKTDSIPMPTDDDIIPINDEEEETLTQYLRNIPAAQPETTQELQSINIEKAATDNDPNF